jgi:YrbI family 3-deoxy-D-manno-octulosonate 8-phosphate phosphatase
LLCLDVDGVLSDGHLYFLGEDDSGPRWGMRFAALCQELGVSAEQAAFVGDELSDLPLLRTVGFAATVPEAVSDLHRAVHYITQRAGGAGAVREVCELILGQRAPRG